MVNAEQPLFQQIATLIEDSIVDGNLSVGQRAPSTNELASFHDINPATARKGIALLVDQGILEQRRGIGTFVTDRAVDVITCRRQAAFVGEFLAPLVDEAVRLGVTRSELSDLLGRVAESRGLYR